VLSCSLDLTGLHVREAFLKTRGINLIGLASLHSLFAQGDCFFLLPGLVQNTRLRREVLERLFHFDRLVQPRHALLVVGTVLIVEQIVRSPQRRAPVVWFGSGDPASGATPQFTYVAPILGQALFPAMGVRDEVSTPVWTMHATAASQKYAPPSGFTPWDGAGTAPTGPTTHLCTSFTPGTGRNDYTGEVGVRLGIGAADVPFQWIGIRCAGGSTTPRRVYVYEWFSNTPISQADIDFTGKAVGDWVWVKVAPATMLANGYYALALKVTAGDGQTWSNPGPTTFEPVFANIYAIYRDTITAPGFANGEINTQFVGLDLGW